MSVQSLAAAALFATTVLAAGVLVKRADITTLSAGQIAELTPYAGFATAAYCKPSTTIDWSCGANCDLNPNFVPVASGGDSGLVQFWYVGYDPSSDSVIVGHQGTDTKNILAILTDADFVLTPLDKTLFPGLPSSILVHNGFENSHARVATEVLAAVNSTLSQYSTSAVTVVGHSLGAALALLNGIYLKLHLPSGTKVQTIGFGMPRVGDKAWANYVDANFNVTHINNRKDPVPILPPILLGYHHASGEVHIEDSGVWVSCPGQDNPSDQCIKGEVPTILQGNTTDHNGPYNGVTMGCSTNS